MNKLLFCYFPHTRYCVECNRRTKRQHCAPCFNCFFIQLRIYTSTTILSSLVDHSENSNRSKQFSFIVDISEFYWHSFHTILRSCTLVCVWAQILGEDVLITTHRCATKTTYSSNSQIALESHELNFFLSFFSFVGSCSSVTATNRTKNCISVGSEPFVCQQKKWKWKIDKFLFGRAFVNGTLSQWQILNELMFAFTGNQWAFKRR